MAVIDHTAVVEADSSDNDATSGMSHDAAATGNSETSASSEAVEYNDLALPIPNWVIVPLAAALAAALWWAFGNDIVLVMLVPFAVFVAAITVIDLRELRIPDRILRPAAVLAIPLVAIASTSDWPDISLVRAAIGAVVYGLVYFTIMMIFPPGMGFGDVKFAPFLGVVLGLFGWIPFGRALIISHFASGAVAILVLIVGLVLRRRPGGFDVRKTAFPFGPFMVVGAVVALLLEGGAAG